MSRTDLTKSDWFKSSHSNGQAECVEVAINESTVAMRDSKNPCGGTLVVSHDEWRAFVNDVAAGEFQP
ncbi:DUF397 domain-containing protein [Streptomyces sp. NPDC057702]|uniref:DUF397 domain-containing protein n=1 Tax=unclassified Streptomyces TaxID=2593676 RepID=UPI003678F965